jgi:hypothetical protein
MGAITFSIDTALLERLISLTQLDTFVETGTYCGDTVATARQYFQRVISIEQSEALYQAARVRFADDPGVMLFQGDSGQALGDLMAELQGRSVLFWLDAHWCAGEEQGDAQTQCPLLSELQAIRRLNKDSLVLIDDARFFLSPPTIPHQYKQWPRLHELLAALQALSPEHRLLILNDVIIFYPPMLEEGLYEFAHTHGVDWLKIAHQSKEHDHVLQDNLAKEAEIQHLAQITEKQQAEIQRLTETLSQHQAWLHTASIDRRFSPLYWARRVLGPPRHRARRAYHQAKHAVRHFILRSKMLSQYPPRTLRIPAHYHQIAIEKENPPVVSLVTPSFNQGHYLQRTIESVLTQNYPRLEYIIQDGGSTDDTQAILEQYRPHLTHVTSMPDKGQADAINKGFKQSSGDIMAWLNSDDLLLPGTMAYVVNYFQTHPHVDVVYGHRIIVDENDLEIGRWVLPGHDEHVLAWADYVPQETLFWRRRIWEKTGGYLDATYQFAIDWELLLRFQRAGATFVRLPRFLAAFRVHDQQKTSALLDTLGKQEMTRLRTVHHGRQVSPAEVQRNISGYLLRSAWLDRLIAWGIVQH